MTTVAILGHAEHGKTSVAQAIQAAGGGMTILDGRIDRSATVAVLVVSAPDGPMPGTRDAAKHCTHVGKLVVFLNKRDLIEDDELLELVELELRELVSATGGNGDGVTIIRGSAKDFLAGKPAAHGKRRGDGIGELVSAIYAV